MTDSTSGRTGRRGDAPPYLIISLAREFVVDLSHWVVIRGHVSQL